MTAEIIISGQGKEMARAMKYTGIRVEKYEVAKASRSLLGKDEYRKVIQRLNREETTALRAKAKRDEAREAREKAEELKRQQEEAKKEAEREAKREAKRIERNKKLKAKREAMKTATDVVLDIKRNPIPADDETEIFELEIRPVIETALAKLVTQGKAYMQFSVNGEIRDSKLIVISGNDGPAIYWNNVYTFLHQYVNGELINVFQYYYNGTDIVAYEPDDVLRFVILKESKIPNEAIRQKYRDGLKHCVLEPLYRLWNKMSEESVSKASAKRCGQIARRLKKLEKTYPDGVPEGLDMEAVARVSHRCIVIHDILGREITSYNTRSPKYFRFTNTRINHLESGKLTWDGDYERITQDRMDKLLFEHDRDDVFYLYGGDVNQKNSNDLQKGNCRSLRSVRGAYAVFNDDYDIFQAFNKLVGINDFGIDAIKYPELNAFIKEGRLINSAPVPLCDEPDNIDDVKQIDIEKAYTQHKLCKFYKGFLGHITDWGKVDVDVSFMDNHLGIYQFVVLSCADEIIGQVGIRVGEKYILPSPEIQYMISVGVSVKLIAGCWGSSFDIEYTPEMLEKRRYCTWAGKLGMDNDCDTYTFKGDATWASALKGMIGYDNGVNKVLYFKECGMIVVNISKKSYKTKHHILAFITSYCRINMMEMMHTMKNQGAELTKVIMDGIYYRGEVKDIALPHSDDKEVIKHGGFCDAWFNPSEIYCEWDVYDDRFDIPVGKVPNVVVLTGAGGTGKSHSILQNASVSDVLYVVPTHVLGRKMRAKTGVRYTTIHKLVGIKLGEKGEEEKCRMYKEEHGVPSAIFIDELTMIEASWIDKAIELYPTSKIFLAGDVDTKQWFQCRNGYTGHFSKVWMPTDKYHIVHYDKDYRAKDDELKSLKVKIRSAMRQVFTDGGQTDAIRMKLYVKSIMPTLGWDDAISLFQPGDVWIAGTQKTNTKLLEAGIVSGYINKNKEIVGTDADGGEKRGSFTTHSFQGLTLETERVFISMDFFEYAMLYTSISRVCRLSQLVIVDGKGSLTKEEWVKASYPDQKLCKCLSCGKEYIEFNISHNVWKTYCSSDCIEEK